MSNHKKENNINLMNQVFINSLINETPVNEDKKEEKISAIEALVLKNPDYKTKIKTENEFRNIQLNQSEVAVSEVSVVPEEVVEEIVEDDSTIMTSEQIGQFASQVISPNYNDLSDQQRLILDDYAVDLIEKSYGEGEDYTIEPVLID